MQAQVFDANGVAVTQNSVFCARCGAHIKHVFPYEGKPYGSSCYEAVSGLRASDWVWADGKPSPEATEAKQRRIAGKIARSEAREQQREATRAANRERFAELIEALLTVSRNQGDFCWSMADQVTNAGYGTKLSEILSDRQIEIVRNIWGKQAGRRNSKAYKAAVKEFDAKFDPEAALYDCADVLREYGVELTTEQVEAFLCNYPDLPTEATEPEERQQIADALAQSLDFCFWPDKSETVNYRGFWPEFCKRAEEYGYKIIGDVE